MDWAHSKQQRQQETTMLSEGGKKGKEGKECSPHLRPPRRHDPHRRSGMPQVQTLPRPPPTPLQKPGDCHSSLLVKGTVMIRIILTQNRASFAEYNIFLLN